MSDKPASSDPPNFRGSKKWPTGTCCFTCYHLRRYDCTYSCLKHLCFVESDRVCDDWEDGRDYYSNFSTRATTQKEYMLLKDALKGKDPDKASLKSVESKVDERRGTLKVDKKITLVKTERGWRFDYCDSPS